MSNTNTIRAKTRKVFEEEIVRNCNEGAGRERG